MIQRLKVNGLQNFDNPLFSDSPGHVTNRDYDYLSDVGFTLGWRDQLADCLGVGASYQPETHMRRFKKYEGFIASNGKFSIPSNIIVGLAYRITPRTVVALDVQHTRWKQIKGLHNNLAPNLFVSKIGEKRGLDLGGEIKHLSELALIMKSMMHGK